LQDIILLQKSSFNLYKEWYTIKNLVKGKEV